MTPTQVFKPVVRNIQNNDLYFFEGGNTFTNIRTGKSGEINDELAQKVLKINTEASLILNEYPQVADMINRLNLKIEK
jgi:hypothetical protein